MQACYVPVIYDIDEDDAMNDMEIDEDAPPPRLTIKVPPRPRVAPRPSAVDPISRRPDPDNSSYASPSPQSSSGSSQENSRRKSGEKKKKQGRRSIGHHTEDRPEIFQSISCTGTLCEKSFEEMRVESYNMSHVATGHPPRPVDQYGGVVMPPSYRPFVDDDMNAAARRADAAKQDVAMADAVSDHATCQPFRTLMGFLSFCKAYMFSFLA
ncbi:hypothetical protein B0H21DRAFT_826966 [Amylocystis lapponica]|nr:hypothetical protein B0H21DRAFT_826966 [Amylocystis lapponica]